MIRIDGGPVQLLMRYIVIYDKFDLWLSTRRRGLRALKAPGRHEVTIRPQPPSPP
jgi:hypothetical protein